MNARGVTIGAMVYCTPNISVIPNKRLAHELELGAGNPSWNDTKCVRIQLFFGGIILRIKCEYDLDTMLMAKNMEVGLFLLLFREKSAATLNLVTGACMT